MDIDCFVGWLEILISFLTLRFFSESISGIKSLKHLLACRFKIYGD